MDKNKVCLYFIECRSSVVTYQCSQPALRDQGRSQEQILFDSRNQALRVQISLTTALPGLVLEETAVTKNNIITVIWSGYLRERILYVGVVLFQEYNGDKNITPMHYECLDAADFSVVYSLEMIRCCKLTETQWRKITIISVIHMTYIMIIYIFYEKTRSRKKYAFPQKNAY